MTDAEGELVGVVPGSRLLAVLGEPTTPAEAPRDTVPATADGMKKVAGV